MMAKRKKRPTVDRCPSCGGMVLMPCQACALPEKPDRQRYDGADASLGLDLAPEDAKRYDKTPIPGPTRETPSQPDGRLVCTPVRFLGVHGGRR